MESRLMQEVRKALLDEWPGGPAHVLVPVWVVERALSEEEIARGFDSDRLRLMTDRDEVLYVRVDGRGR